VAVEAKTIWSERQNIAEQKPIEADTLMTTWRRNLAGCLVLASCGLAHSGAVELKVSREALERTLVQQLFGGPNGGYY
jgi:hypothetical protein